MVDIDPAAISLMLRNKRKMTPHEAHQISVILGLPLNEIMRQAGIEVVDDVRRVPIAAYMDADGNVTAMPVGTHDIVIGPADCPVGTYAIQVRSPETIKDGWLLFVTPAQIGANDNLDNLCAVATSAGKHLVSVVRRGYRKNSHNLVAWPSGELLADTDVAWSSSVLWIKPA